MKITARVIGIRLYSSGNRYVTFQWTEEKTEKNQFPISHSIEIKDETCSFALADEAIITIEHPGVAN